jgi:hypothetical protein
MHKETVAMENRRVYVPGWCGVIGGLLPVFCYAAIVVVDPDIMG